MSLVAGKPAFPWASLTKERTSKWLTVFHSTYLFPSISLRILILLVHTYSTSSLFHFLENSENSAEWLGILRDSLQSCREILCSDRPNLRGFFVRWVRHIHSVYENILSWSKTHVFPGHVFRARKAVTILARCSFIVHVADWGSTWCTLIKHISAIYAEWSSTKASEWRGGVNVFQSSCSMIFTLYVPFAVLDLALS